jgi:tetratricopeptide (TPR) repeat protein
VVSARIRRVFNLERLVDAVPANATLMRISWVLLWLAMWPLITACSTERAVYQPPPIDRSSTAQWMYGAYLLSAGDAESARGFLEPIVTNQVNEIVEPALLLRDVAEARLFTNDRRGAAEAARTARVWLARQPRTAQFQEDDRRLFEHVLDSLAAAGDDNLNRLRELSADEHPAPSADGWYLLGRVLEDHGDLAAARSAYREFLARDPQWTFLRMGEAMRRHAASTL